MLTTWTTPHQDFDHLTAEESYKKLLGLPIRLVLTTRTEQEGQVQVGPLNQEELRTIMRRFYTAPDEVLDALIDAVNGHTLAVELMARMLKADRRMTADTLLERLNTVGGLNREKDVRISSQKDRTRAGFGEKERIYEHLRILFDCSSLDNSEQMLLRHGFLIPDIGMDSALFLDCEPEDAAEPLDKLIELGWLQESRGETRILTMHPLVREVVWGELKPDGDNCKAFLDALWHQYDPNGTYSAPKLEQMAESFARAAEILPLELAEQALLWNTSGHLFGKLGNYPKQLDVYEKALAISEKIQPPDYPLLALSCDGLGAIWGAMGNHHKELNFYQKALVIRKKIFPPDLPALSASYTNIGYAWSKLGEYSKELACYQKALAIQQQIIPPNRLALAVIYNNIGSVKGELGQHEEERQYKEQALSILEELLPPHHPYLASSYNNLGYTWYALGNYRKELFFFQKALIIREDILQPDHPDLAASYNNIGYAWHALGDHSKELDFFQQALAIREKVLPPNHPDLATSYSNVGYALAELYRHREALDCYQKSFAIREQILPFGHPDRVKTLRRMARVCGVLGDVKHQAEYNRRADLEEHGPRP